MATEDWKAEAQRLNALCEATQKAIRLRDRAYRTGADPQPHIHTISENLKTLNTNIALLEKQLSDAEQNRSISSEELRRRETTIIDLISYRDRLDTLATTKNGERKERSVHFADSVTTISLAPPDEIPTADTLLQQQHRSIQEQDAHLDVLSEIVSKQKNISLQIGEELDLHSELLEDLDEGVQRSGAFLNRASKKLSQVTTAAKKDWTSIVMCILIMIIIAVVAIALFTKLL